jgi:hypothetical protein
VIIKALARRTAVVLALILPAAGLVLAAGLPQASACSTYVSNTVDDHCYALAQNNHVAANHGVMGDLEATCLYEPNNGTFVTDEVWDGEGSSANDNYWVEAGIRSGTDYYNFYRGDEWFAADQFPGENYDEDDTGTQAKLNTLYPVEITYFGGGTWDFIGENNTNIFFTATASFSATQAQGGSEYTSNAGSGLRDIGNIYDLRNQGLDGTWYDLGTAASNYDFGPGAFISSSYNHSTSEESWSGPC